MPNPFQLNNLQFWLLNAPFFALLLLLSISSLSLIGEKLLLWHRWHCRDKQLPVKASKYLKNSNLQQLSQMLTVENGPEALLLRTSFDFIKYELENPSSERSHNELDNEAGLGLTQLSLPPFAQSSLASGVRNPDSENSPKPYPTNQHSQISRLEHCIEACIEDLGLQLEKHCNLFHLIANLATLLGLLGTVTGMIYAFQSGALEQSSQLAQGISQALVTTAAGLIVAIPAIISQQLFLNASTLRISRLEQLGHSIIFFQYKRLELQSKYLQTQYNRRTSPEDQNHPATEREAKHLAGDTSNLAPKLKLQQPSAKDLTWQKRYTEESREHNNKDLAELQRMASIQRSEEKARLTAKPITGPQTPSHTSASSFPVATTALTIAYGTESHIVFANRSSEKTKSLDPVQKKPQKIRSMQSEQVTQAAQVAKAFPIDQEPKPVPTGSRKRSTNRYQKPTIQAPKIEVPKEAGKVQEARMHSTELPLAERPHGRAASTRSSSAAQSVFDWQRNPLQAEAGREQAPPDHQLDNSSKTPQTAKPPTADKDTLQISNGGAESEAPKTKNPQSKEASWPSLEERVAELQRRKARALPLGAASSRPSSKSNYDANQAPKQAAPPLNDSPPQFDKREQENLPSSSRTQELAAMGQRRHSQEPAKAGKQSDSRNRKPYAAN